MSDDSDEECIANVIKRASATGYDYSHQNEDNNQYGLDDKYRSENVVNTNEESEEEKENSGGYSHSSSNNLKQLKKDFYERSK